MIRPLSLSARLALLFAACTAVVSLAAGALFDRASEMHFLELDQQLLESRAADVRDLLAGIDDELGFITRRDALHTELNRESDEGVRILDADGHPWFDSRPALPAASSDAGLATLQSAQGAYRTLNAPLFPDQPQSPRLIVLLDITHHQHFLQRMQRLIWLTVGLSALATALLGAWAARLSLRPLRRMTEVTGDVSAHSLTTRLPVEHLPPELAVLGHSLNGMLARLEDAFTRLSAFSADIAHELRTPLSNLLTHTQVTLTRARSADEYEEALHGNLEELQRLAQLVNDMLFLAKADHGLLPADRAPLAIEDEVGDLLEFFAPLAQEAGIALHDRGAAQVSGDRALLRRALSNLLDNALRFTPAGGEVRVSMSEDAEGALIEVANTGPAIPEAVRHRLFDRFYRVDAARSAGTAEHAGLGLAITRSIVQAHGGWIECECAEGWTRFVVRLPA